MNCNFLSEGQFCQGERHLRSNVLLLVLFHHWFDLFSRNYLNLSEMQQNIIYIYYIYKRSHFALAPCLADGRCFLKLLKGRYYGMAFPISDQFPVS